MSAIPLVVCEREQGEEFLPARISPEMKRIAQLKERAIASPESRKAIVRSLEQYMEKKRGTREGRAAQKAVSVIIAVSMLEVLQGI